MDWKGYFEQRLGKLYGQFTEDNPDLVNKLTAEGFQPELTRLLERVAMVGAESLACCHALLHQTLQTLLDIVQPSARSPEPSVVIAQFRLDTCGQLTKINKEDTFRPHAIEVGHPLSDVVFSPTRDLDLTFHDVTSCNFVENGQLTALRESVPAHLQRNVSDCLAVQLTSPRTSRVDYLRFFIATKDLDEAFATFEALFENLIGITLTIGQGNPQWYDGNKTVRHVGLLSDSDLPREAHWAPAVSLNLGERLLRDAISFPRKLLFFDVCDIPRDISSCTCWLRFFFNRKFSHSDEPSLLLNCVPLLNQYDNAITLSLAPEQRSVDIGVNPHKFLHESSVTIDDKALIPWFSTPYSYGDSSDANGFAKRYYHIDRRKETICLQLIAGACSGNSNSCLRVSYLGTNGQIAERFPCNQDLVMKNGSAKCRLIGNPMRGLWPKPTEPLDFRAWNRDMVGWSFDATGKREISRKIQCAINIVGRTDWLEIPAEPYRLNSLANQISDVEDSDYDGIRRIKIQIRPEGKSRFRWYFLASALLKYLRLRLEWHEGIDIEVTYDSQPLLRRSWHLD